MGKAAKNSNIYCSAKGGGKEGRSKKFASLSSPICIAVSLLLIGEEGKGMGGGGGSELQYSWQFSWIFPVFSSEDPAYRCESQYIWIFKVHDMAPLKKELHEPTGRTYIPEEDVDCVLILNDKKQYMEKKEIDTLFLPLW